MQVPEQTKCIVCKLVITRDERPFYTPMWIDGALVNRPLHQTCKSGIAYLDPVMYPAARGWRLAYTEAAA